MFVPSPAGSLGAQWQRLCVLPLPKPANAQDLTLPQSLLIHANEVSECVGPSAL